MADILSAVEAESGLSVRDLAERTGLHRSTVSRLSTGMVNHLMLARTAAGLKLGPRFRRTEPDRPDTVTRRLVFETLQDLRDVTGRTVRLARLRDRSIVYTDVLRGPVDLPRPPTIGTALTARSTAAGKVILAHIPGPATGTEDPTLRDELCEIRTSGLAVEWGAAAAGSGCVAACVIVDDAVFGAISVALADVEDVDRVGLAVRTAARGLARRLATVTASRERSEASS
ncbi:IclR family transcriptional regulator [Pseudonocardia xishanensis]|uniref:IclR family transcriptional regulator n=1 Tax=Pseudonocardia xishanensis TaxID=630995 RepID=UPI0031F0CCAE